MELREFFSEDAVKLDLEGATKDDILKELVGLFELGDDLGLSVRGHRIDQRARDAAHQISVLGHRARREATRHQAAAKQVPGLPAALSVGAIAALPAAMAPIRH